MRPDQPGYPEAHGAGDDRTDAEAWQRQQEDSQTSSVEKTIAVFRSAIALLQVLKERAAEAKTLPSASAGEAPQESVATSGRGSIL